MLVTGGAGFIGSNFVRMALHAGMSVVNLDALTYAGNLENLTGVEERGDHTFIRGDITDPAAVREAMDGVDCVINFAAETHVDRSISRPAPFVRTNVLGTQVLLDAALRCKVERYVQVSTDEVYGSLGPEGRFTERSPLDPSSPYSASKAAADLLTLAYHKTHGMPCVITRCSNNYGPYQFPEKLIPLMITNAMEGRELPVYGDGENVRDWIHVEDHCRAVLRVVEDGAPGEIYNIGGDSELRNIDLVKQLVEILGVSEELIRFVVDRPGHDRRYAVDSSKMEAELGWRRTHDFDSGLRQTVEWYRACTGWWTRVKSGSYREGTGPPPDERGTSDSSGS